MNWMFFANLVILLINVLLLSQMLKMYTEIFKERAISSRLLRRKESSDD